MSPSHIKGMVFGVFDGLHEGHKHFLGTASEKCEELIVAVAPDEAASTLKGRAPKYPLSTRMDALRAFDPKLSVIAGDVLPGSWEIFKTVTPDVVFIGYDQQKLAEALDRFKIPFEELSAFEPQRFKSSLIHGEETASQ